MLSNTPQRADGEPAERAGEQRLVGRSSEKCDERQQQDRRKGRFDNIMSAIVGERIDVRTGPVDGQPAVQESIGEEYVIVIRRRAPVREDPRDKKSCDADENAARYRDAVK